MGKWKKEKKREEREVIGILDRAKNLFTKKKGKLCGLEAESIQVKPCLAICSSSAKCVADNG